MAVRALLVSPTHLTSRATTSSAAGWGMPVWSRSCRGPWVPLAAERLESEGRQQKIRFCFLEVWQPLFSTAVPCAAGAVPYPVTETQSPYALTVTASLLSPSPTTAPQPVPLRRSVPAAPRPGTTFSKQRAPTPWESRRWGS